MDDTITGWNVELFNGDHVPGKADGFALSCDDQPVVGTIGECLDVFPLRECRAVFSWIANVNVDKLLKFFLVAVSAQTL